MATAQPKFQWSSYRDLESLTGGTGTGWSLKVIPRPGGGFYAMGYTYLARFEDNGSLVWKFHHAGSITDATVVGGNVVIAGANSQQNNLLGFLSEVDDNGNQVWNQTFAYEPMSQYGPDFPLIGDASGNVYVGTGNHLNKYSSSGSFLWSQPASITGGLVLSGTNIVACGRITGGSGIAQAFSAAGAPIWTHPLQYEVTASQAGPSGSILAGSTVLTELDSNGNQVWQTPLGGGGFAIAIHLNPLGNIAVSCEGSVGLLNSTGVILWSKNTAGTYPKADGLILDSSNNVTYCGLNLNGLTPGPFVEQFSSTGNEAFYHFFPSTNPEGDSVNSIFLASNGAIEGVASLMVPGQPNPGPEYPYATLFSLDPAGAVNWSQIEDLGGANVTTKSMCTTPAGVSYVLSGAGSTGNEYGTEDIYPNNFAGAPAVLTKVMASGRADWSLKVSNLLGTATLQLAPNNGIVLAGNLTSYDSVTDSYAQTGSVVRYDDAGKRNWTKTFATGYYVQGLATTSAAIYVMGANQSPSSVTKLGSSGTQAWTTTLPIIGLDMQTDGSGNVYATGQATNNSFGVVKVSPAGVILWNYMFPGSTFDPNDYGLQVTVDSLGVYVRAKVLGDDGGFADIVVKLDLNGNLLWQTTPQADDFQTNITRMVPDRTGGVFLSGMTNDQTPSKEMYIQRVDTNGNTLWTYLCPGAYASINQKMITDFSGFVYTTADLMSPTTGADFGVYKLSPSGTPAWPSSAASYRNHALFFDHLANDDNTLCISQDPLSAICIGGPSYGPNGTTDINLVKFGYDNSQYVTQTFPSTMTASQSYQVSVTLKNVGSTTWTAARGYKLVPVYPNWGVTSVPLAAADSIAPGQSKTFTFSVTTPPTKGTANSRWTMQRSSTMFGAESKFVAVSVG